MAIQRRYLVEDPTFLCQQYRQARQLQRAAQVLAASADWTDITRDNGRKFPPLAEMFQIVTLTGLCFFLGWQMASTFQQVVGGAR